MYFISGIVGMLLFGAFNAWIDVWMLGGFIVGIMIYIIFYIIKNTKNTGSTSADNNLPSCLLFAIIGGLLEGI